MASTINGYEGTGRSLSLKLLDQLRQQSSRLAVTANDGGSAARTLQECELQVLKTLDSFKDKGGLFYLRVPNSFCPLPGKENLCIF